MGCVCTLCGAGAQHTGAPVAARLSGLFLGLGLGLFLPVYMQMQMRLCLHLHLLMYMGLYVYLYLVCARMRSYAFAFVFGMASNAYRCFFTEMHFVASPPALEESLRGVARGGIRNTPLAVLWVLSDEGKYRTAGSYRNEQGVEQVSVSRTWCVLPPASQNVAFSRTHSFNPTFSFRPAEKKTCR